MSIAAKSSAGKFSAADAQYNTCLAVFWNFLGTMREVIFDFWSFVFHVAHASEPVIPHRMLHPFAN